MSTRNEAFAPGTPCWSDATADDLDGAIAFYSGLFGWTVERGPAELGGYSNASLDGKLVAALTAKFDANLPSVWTTYLATADAAKTCAAIETHGGTVLSPPMAVMAFGTMAIATDPAGAVFGLWEAGTHTGYQRYNEPGSITWNEVFVTDMEVGKRFYSSVFGHTFTDIDGPVAYASTEIDGNTVGGIGEIGAGFRSDMQPGWNNYFSVTSADDAVGRITELGGTIVRGPDDTPFGRMALVTDNQGAYFSVHQAPDVPSS